MRSTAENRRERSEQRGLGALLLALAYVWLAVAIYVAHAALPFNPVRLPYERLVHASAWAPQGWGFYTRNPRAETVQLYVRREGGGWERLSFGPNRVDRANAFGLNRVSRAQLAEVLSLASRVPKQAYQPCAEEPVVCLEKTPVAGSLPGGYANLKVKGQVGVVMQPPVPWAWSGSGASIVMPSRVASVEVTEP